MPPLNIHHKKKDQQYYAHILGLKGKLTKADIKKSYRELIAKYHPDKVQHLGTEFLDIAQAKSKEINEAYKYFQTKYEL